MKTIKYYRKSQFGNDREFIHPDNARDGEIIRAIYGLKTIDARTRDLITELTGGTVIFSETIAP